MFGFEGRSIPETTTRHKTPNAHRFSPFSAGSPTVYCPFFTVFYRFHHETKKHFDFLIARMNIKRHTNTDDESRSAGGDVSLKTVIRQIRPIVCRALSCAKVVRR